MPRKLSGFAAIAIAMLIAPFASAIQDEGNSKASVPSEWMDHFEWRSIGPANMSGRITSIAVYEKDSRIWYVATASGGLLKTTNNGIEFEHQFDDQSTVSIGDVQVSQTNPDIVWVGTGEANPRNSVSWGDGVYKSVDGGKTWKNMGLKNSFQIGRIAIHPKNPDIVYVGALGRLWGPNEERGLFKTTDGGKTWEKILYVDDSTGVIDVKMHPKDPETLMVATYERQRDGFDGNDPEKKYGEGSGIYRTTNGGKSFKRISKGLPSCKLGRVGFDWYRKNPKIVYAIVESEKIAQGIVGYAGLTGEDADVGAKMSEVVEDGPAYKAGLRSGDIITRVNGETVQSYSKLLDQLRSNKPGDKVKLEISRDREKQDIVVELGERTRRRRGNRPASGPDHLRGTLGGQAANRQGQQHSKDNLPEEEYGGVYMSKDAGKSWKRINTLNPRPMYYSQVRVDPSDNQKMYVLGTSLYRSTDGGKTFTGDGGRGIHPDNHAMWIDPKLGDHIILGNDGGIHVTYDRMDNWDHLNHVAIGQFYHVGIDHTRDYKVYGGLQDNGSWGGPAQTRSGGPVNSDWYRVGGGDGFITLVDPEDKDQIYYESQNGAMGSINLRTGDRGFAQPRSQRGQPRYRFNWKTPFILSPHNSKMHYSAGNHVFRSFYKGQNAKAISPEITNTDRGAGSAISESPVTAGVIYAGTTDGAIWMTRDGGKNWEEIFVQREESTDESDEAGDDEKSDSPSDRKTRDARKKDAKPDPSGSEKVEKNPARRGDGARGKRKRTRDRRAEQRDGTKRSEGKKDPKAPKRSSDKSRKAEAESKKPARKDKSARKDPKKTPKKDGDRKSGKTRKVPSKDGDKKPPKRKKADGKNEMAELEAPSKTEEKKSSNESLDDCLIGVWQGQMEFDGLEEDQSWVRLTIQRNSNGALTGKFSTPRSVSQLSKINLTKSGNLKFLGENDIQNVEFDCQLNDARNSLEGKIDMGRFQIPFDCKKLDKVSAVKDSTNFKLAGFRISTTDVVSDDVTGIWKAFIESDELPDGRMELTIELKMDENGELTGNLSTMMGDMEVYEGRFDAKSKKLRMDVGNDDGMEVKITADVDGKSMAGMISAGEGQFEMEFTAEMTSEKIADAEPKATSKPKKKAEAKTPSRKKAAGSKESSARKKKAKTGGAKTSSEKKKPQESAGKDDPVTGKWEGRYITDSRFGQGENAKFTLNLIHDGKGNVTGTIETARGDNNISEGKFDPKENSLKLVADNPRFELEYSGEVKKDRISGDVDFGGRASFDFEAKRVDKTAKVASASEQAGSDEEKPVEGSRLGDLVPGPRWVSSIEASRHKASRVYLTLDGHRSNDDEPYVFTSEDFGKTWSSLRANLPTSAGTTRVLREDIENENLLFLGCEFSAWVSIDRGKSWTRFKGGLPTVAVHEIAIHPKSGEIVAGTHGRSLWVADITGLRKLSKQVLNQPVALLEPNSVVRWRRAQERGNSGNRRFVGENPDNNARFYYYIGERVREASLTVKDLEGNLIKTLEAKTDRGLNLVKWDLRRDRSGNQRRGRRGFGGGVPAGKYLITLTVDGKEFTSVLEIQQDPVQQPSAVSEEEWELMKMFQGVEEEEEQKPETSGSGF